MRNRGRCDGAEGQLAITVPVEADKRRLDPIEILPIPLVGLHDPPAAEDLALDRVARGKLGKRTAWTALRACAPRS
jgi:hypothetical protein